MDDFANLFGGRLRDERKRLALNQDNFAATGGVNKATQISYEKGKRSPDVAYMHAISSLGVDIAYILTGKKIRTEISREENILLGAYNEAPLAVRQAALAALIFGSGRQTFNENYSGVEPVRNNVLEVNIEEEVYESFSEIALLTGESIPDTIRMLVIKRAKILLAEVDPLALETITKAAAKDMEARRINRDNKIENQSVTNSSGAKKSTSSD
ncbi:helix-turn-helix domain-containing protein [Glaciimonas sp. PAMC28666]|uniref:helix-turn-helix domain-containing protein n=1 Tax=Glaciimonas sp. PAMC28666 TaxID=2807626 RepID=UPI0019653DE4|nr:helix-turn-helix transcriptional regulator [Glaciimonas sp. PAMC28666]QRX80821.1 helix-turn-helix transcriptional regulator [Glaciimonas sp. PAMC28666]